MTKTNHRLHTLQPPRRTPGSYPGVNVGIHKDHPMRELAYFDYAFHTRAKLFGKREPSGLKACAANCGEPCCKNGCTLLGRFD